MCRVGDGWTALVAAQEEGCTIARAGSLLYGARKNIREEGGRAVSTTHNTEWWSYHYGTGGE